ncbi:MAG: M20/M25/M40 family metallo-hydrolase, partial [Clostridia bacterium]|nr:M20/M25/M40 family metallo-hydrolase [Clostridia bacterium]
LAEGGFLRCRALGGVDARVLMGEVVRVHGRQAVEGVVAFLPPHLTGGRERQEAPAVEELVVDTGLPDERLRRLIQPGDPITVRRRCQRLAGRLVTGKAMDNRAGVAALWVALRQLAGRRCAAEVAVAFTVQEELGYRGAAVLGERLRPDVALVVDVGFGGQPGVAEADALALGRGPGVTVGPNVHPLVRARLLATAAAERLPHQVEVTAGGSGTDAEALQVSGTGVATAVLSIPCRSMHSPAEVVSLDDVEATGRLLAAFAVATGEDDGWVGKLRDGSWALGG